MNMCHGALRLVLFSLLLFIPHAATRAVIVFGGDGTQNTTAPADDPGWANVGVRGGTSGVYLGNQWVITAAHVGAGSITFGSTTYNAVPNSSVRLKNPDNSDADLVLFQIDGDPQLPALSISASTPANGSTVIMIGNGRNREADVTTWNVLWEEDAGGTIQGYKWAAGQTMRWGENTVSGTLFGNDTHSFQTRFSPTTNDGQAAAGDSGGAVFFKNGGEWELAGIIHSITIFSGQPAETSVYMFGLDANRTVIGDLAQYSDQILAVVPEPSTNVLVIAGVLALVAAGRRNHRTACSRGQ